LIITEKDLLEFKNLKEKYKKQFERFKKTVESCKKWENILRILGEKEVKKQFSEEADAEIVEMIIMKIWERGIRDTELISKIICGNAFEIGEISDLLEKYSFSSPLQIKKSIERIFSKR